MNCQLRAISFLCALAIGLHASPAAALSKHRLLASINSFLGEFTLDPNDSSAEIFFEQGVAGTDPNSRSLFASVNSASGVFVVNGQTNSLSLPNQSRAVARLEQLMDMNSVPIVIDATLILDGGGTGGFIELDASLQVGECIAGLRRGYPRPANEPRSAGYHALPCVAATLFATTAHAQGPPPFDLRAPASSSQIVEMGLNAEDADETSPGRTAEISSIVEESLVRDQHGAPATAPCACSRARSAT